MDSQHLIKIFEADDLDLFAIWKRTLKTLYDPLACAEGKGFAGSPGDDSGNTDSLEPKKVCGFRELA